MGTRRLPTPQFEFGDMLNVDGFLHDEVFANDLDLILS